MTEQSNLPTQRVNISTQKMLGGIGYILVLLPIPVIWIFLSIAGYILVLISLYQLSNILRKPSIFKKILISIILAIAGSIIALAIGLMTGVSLFASVRDETGAILGLGFGTAITIILIYAIIVVAVYFFL